MDHPRLEKSVREESRESGGRSKLQEGRSSGQPGVTGGGVDFARGRRREIDSNRSFTSRLEESIYRRAATRNRDRQPVIIMRLLLAIQSLVIDNTRR